MSVSAVLPALALGVFLGDSLTDANGGVGGAVCWYAAALEPMREAFVVAGRAHGAPIWLMKGVAGNTIAAITARVTTDVPANATAVAIACGTNDGTNFRNQAQANTDTLALIDAVVARCPGLRFLVVMGPGCVGDQWPEGVNSPYDPTLTAVNAGIAQACATRGVPFINIRAKLFADLPTLNPGNTLGGSGLFVFNGGDGSCKHWTLAGQAYASAYFLTQISFAEPL